MPSSSCPQIPSAVLRSGATPVIIDTRRDLLLTTRALRRLDELPQAVIAVHQWGLPCPLTELRETLGSQVAIIEDAAQAWDMHSTEVEDARTADVAVTSMGPGKMLCIDGGGAAFADSDIGAHIDTWSSGQRKRREPALAIAISKFALPHISAAVAGAEARTAELRQRVPELLDRLTQLGLEPWSAENGPSPSWGRVPVRVRDQREFARLRHAEESAALGVSAPAQLEGITMLEGRAVSLRLPETPSRWLLLDPVAALANPSLVERWAKRARS